MDDDIFSLATEPIINNSDPSIYEDETQAIIGVVDDSPSVNQAKPKHRANLQISCHDDSPTQKLDFIEKEKSLKTRAHETTAEETIDSDCDTIPASPVFDIEEDLNMEKDPSRAINDAKSGASECSKRPTIAVDEDKILDLPKGKIQSNSSFDHSADDILTDEPTQLLPGHPVTVFRESSMDAPTQKLPTIHVFAVAEENSMDAPTQPFLGGRKAFALSDHEDSMDAPTQPFIPKSKKDCIEIENSMDAPTQPFIPRSKEAHVYNENSMDAPTQPLRIAKPKLSIDTSPQDIHSDREDRPTSPTLDLGLPSTRFQPDEVKGSAETNENDDTQPIDFDPQTLVECCQTKSSDCISPMPFHGEAFRLSNAVSASSTPYQKKTNRVGNEASEQRCKDKASVPFFPPMSPKEKKDDGSDAETLPGTPGLDLGSPSPDFIPCSQEEDEELSSPVRRSLVLKSLQKANGEAVDLDEFDEPAKSPILSPKNSFKQRQLMENKENEPIAETRCVGANSSRHQITSSRRDDTECESPVFDFDGSSEAIVDETRTASPTNLDFQDSPPIIAETPFVGSGPSPRKKRKIIRRSGYCINNSTFLQQSTASEDTMTDTTEGVSAGTAKPLQLPPYESELEESDVELTFASRRSSISSQSSGEPFAGFTTDDKEQISGDLKLMRKVIDADEKELNEEIRKRRTSQRSAQTLRNSDLYEGGSSVKGKSMNRSSSSSSSAEDMDIESSDDEQQVLSAVARKRLTVSSTPSTTNVTVDMEIASPFDVEDQDKDTTKHSAQTRRSKRPSDAMISDSAHAISAAQSAKNDAEPAEAKGAANQVRSSTSKRLSSVKETMSRQSIHSGETRRELDQKETEVSEKETEKATTSFEADKAGSINGKVLKVSRNSEVTLPAAESCEAQTRSNVTLGRQSRPKRIVTRKASEEAVSCQQETAATKSSNPKDGAEQPVPSTSNGDGETVVKKAKRGRLPKKALEAQIHSKEPESSRIPAKCEAIDPPVLKAAPHSNKQQEVASKRKVGRSKTSRKDGDSTVGESSDEPEIKQTAVASAKPSASTERNDKATDEETFHQPKLPVRRGRRRRVGSDASSTSNVSIRTDAESSDEASVREPQRGSTSTAESSGDEQTTEKARASKQSCNPAPKTNAPAMNPIDAPPTPNPPIKRGRGRPRKDALNDSVSSTSGAGPSRGAPKQSSLNASVNSPAIDASRRRKRALAGQVRVLFTVVDDYEDREIVVSLGGKVVTHSKDCSVLVTDRIRRTVKFLCCVGRGVPIVGRDWLEKCKASGKFLDPWLHLLSDKEGEEKFKFKLAKSLKVSSEIPLLSGVSLHATAGVLPPPVEMQEIIVACGGAYAEDSEDMSGENKFVITCPEDKKIWPYLRRRKVKLIDKEAILTGILQQSFEPEKFPPGS